MHLTKIYSLNPILEDGLSELGTKRVHLRIPEDVGEYLLVVPVVDLDLR